MKTIKLLLLWFQIYALDINIKGQDECLALVKSPTLHFKITVARSNARRERTRLRGEFNALLPIGQRRTWTLA